MRQTSRIKRQSATYISDLLCSIAYTEASLSGVYTIINDKANILEEFCKLDEEKREEEGWKYYIAVGSSWATGSTSLWEITKRCIERGVAKYLLEITQVVPSKDNRPLYNIDIEQF